MTKKVLIYAVIGFWLVMMGLFVRREVLPYAFAHPPAGYGAVRAYARMNPTSHMLIYDGTESRNLIGASETSFLLQADGTCEITTETVIDFRRHGQFLQNEATRQLVASLVQQFVLQSELVISPENTLQSFRLTTHSTELQTTARGFVEGGTLHITAVLNNDHFDQPRHFHRSIPVQKQDVLAHNFMPVGWVGDLRVGQAWRFQVIDPISFGISSAQARVTSKENLRIGDGLYEVYVVEFPRQVGTARAYVDEANRLLRQTVEAWGLTIEFVRFPLPHQDDVEVPEDLLEQFITSPPED